MATLAVSLGGIASAPATAASGPIGAHSMLYSNTPAAFKSSMFQGAAAMGASEIRVDLDISAVWGSPTSAPDWSSVDQYMWLAAAYHVRVLADIVQTPYWLASCQTASQQIARPGACGTDQPARYAEYAGAIAAHTKGLIDDFELINEPDGQWAFTGTPQQYAWMLADSYDAIHRADPNARVLNGGLMTNRPDAWTRGVLGVQGARVIRKIDVLNVHIRDAVAKLSGDLTSWRSFFARNGITVPLWVTEHGYPSDPAYQYDASYRGTDRSSGLRQQARYLTASVPTLLRAGAAKVFVTERDDLGGPWASEGVLGGQVTDPVLVLGSYAITRKPSFNVLAALAAQSTPVSAGAIGTAARAFRQTARRRRPAHAR